VNYEQLVVTQERAVQALDALGIDPSSDFYTVMKEVAYFPSGRGDNLYNLNEITDPQILYYWDAEYPNLSKDYLSLSSIEGEGSYFYRKSNGAIYDAGWNEMADLAAGKLVPRWNSFSEFLDWHYEEL
jgi:hypothetical protein